MKTHEGLIQAWRQVKAGRGLGHPWTLPLLSLVHGMSSAGNGDWVILKMWEVPLRSLLRRLFIPVSLLGCAHLHQGLHSLLIVIQP